jgi:molybdopterin converting factor small subunit
MQVKVRVFGDIVSDIGRNHTVTIDEGATVGILTKEIALRAGQNRRGHLGRYRIGGADLAILVNGKNIDLLEGIETILRDGDDVVLLIQNMGG